MLKMLFSIVGGLRLVVGGWQIAVAVGRGNGLAMEDGFVCVCSANIYPVLEDRIVAPLGLEQYHSGIATITMRGTRQCLR